jgi:hypothetical protein
MDRSCSGRYGGRPGHWAKESITDLSVLRGSLDASHESVSSERGGKRGGLLIRSESPDSVAGLEPFSLCNVLM